MREAAIQDVVQARNPGLGSFASVLALLLLGHVASLRASSRQASRPTTGGVSDDSLKVSRAGSSGYARTGVAVQ
jgi:hypothetical protein